MIVSRLSGGLGNQLFQYAAGRGLASRLGVELALDLSWFGKRFRQTTSRPYELFHYPLQARLLTAGEVPRIALYTHALLKRLPLPRGPLRLYREKGFGYDPRVPALDDDTFLNGYWQSPRYFDHIAADIRSEATPRAPMSDEDRRIADLIGGAGPDSVAVHVRRGDYVTLAAAAKTHGALSPDYYRTAMRTMVESMRAPHFFMFSDDPEWARSNITLETAHDGVARIAQQTVASQSLNVTHVAHNGPRDAFQDLRLMSLCRHQIIANSSLSWWGAWLNANPQKLVVAPSRWLVAATDTSDLIPDGWKKIDDPLPYNRPVQRTEAPQAQ